MDVGRSFTYIFEDPRWLTKLVIGALLGLVPIVGTFFVNGYLLEITQRVVRGEARPLPEWENFGEKLIKGFLLFLIELIYALPLIVLMGLMSGLFSVSGNTTSEVAAVLAGIFGTGFLCLSVIYGLAFWFALPAIVAQYAVTEEFGAAFRLGEIFRLLRGNIEGYFLVLVMALLAGFVGTLGIIACFIGVIFTAFYGSLVIYHLYGQAYRVRRA